MYKVISATEARVHLGEMLRLAQSAPVIIARGGKPLAVLISKQEYDRLTKGENWRQALSEAHQAIREQIGGRALPDPAEMIREAREIRDEQTADALR